MAISPSSETGRPNARSIASAKLQAAYQGRDLVRAQPIQAVLGPPIDSLLTVVEYPTIARLRDLLATPEYQAARVTPEVPSGRAWALTGLVPTPEPLPPSRYPPAYVVTRYRAEEAARMAQFRGLFGGLMAAHGGRFLVRTDDAQVLSGPVDGKLASLSEFPSLQHALHGVSSDEFRELLSVGPGFDSMTIWIANGVMGKG